MNNLKTFENELIKVDIRNYNNQLVVSSRAIAEGLEKQ
jgi:hypothetical protein